MRGWPGWPTLVLRGPCGAPQDEGGERERDLPHPEAEGECGGPYRRAARGCGVCHRRAERAASLSGRRSGKPEPLPLTPHLDPPAARASRSAHQPHGTTISPHPEVRRPKAGASKDGGGWLGALSLSIAGADTVARSPPLRGTSGCGRRESAACATGGWREGPTCLTGGRGERNERRSRGAMLSTPTDGNLAL